ncbi:hypothetical protein ALI144C_43305 [Actinosynnema sp. ALI-1.44]|uniref:DUF6049 family protein n=1 Tax=Actinosynnema sp. ALI-1.44 TaxID=1933779 RepID=UPI00097C5A3D|nr:DUF6049 family protein [Actinosynnema sp. ALI-1.44]ONI72830.1 hypothetical protein ALI144C_43305 [Actinosynnema sp. ALI-1.44]
MSGLRNATRHKLAALVAAGVVLTGSAPLTAAAQQPGPEPLFAPIGLARTQPSNSPPRLRLDVDQLNPRVIRSDTPQITVMGKVTNVGDRRIEQVEVRLQRGDVVTEEGKLRAAMTQPPAAEAARPPFKPVTKSLEKGASTAFTATYTLDELKLDQPGVYPLLINVNGRPEYGGSERLAGLNVLMPVLSLPGRSAPPAQVPPKVTVLWPLVDEHPRVVRQRENDRQLLLADDDLASSVQIGGRLHGLLNAVESATKQNPKLMSSLCFAIDGDLLETLQAMTNGYQVQVGDDKTVPGRGKDFARRWLDGLRSLTSGQCVIALPYADADVSALSRAGAVDLAKTSVNQGVTSVSKALEPTKPQQGVLWPVDGTVDPRALSDVGGLTPTVVLANPERLKGVKGPGPFTLGQNDRVLPIDRLTSLALAGPASAAGPVSVQNGLAALLFRSTRPGQSVLVAPPRRWTAPASELTVYLETIGRMFTDNLATASPFADLADSPEGSATALDYPEQDVAAEVPAGLIDQVSQANAVQRDLLGAMLPDDTRPVLPETLMTPVRNGLLRAASSGWRGNVEGGRQAAATAVKQLDDMRAQVKVNPPGPPIVPASSNSPIPVRITNTLPVDVLVKLVIKESAGLRPGVVQQRRIPAGNAFTDLIPVELLRSGKFTVDVQVTTPGGTQLGNISKFEITSGAYGTITVAVTSVAGGMLVLLASRRVYRRIKQRKKQEPTPA